MVVEYAIRLLGEAAVYTFRRFWKDATEAVLSDNLRAAMLPESHTTAVVSMVVVILALVVIERSLASVVFMIRTGLWIAIVGVSLVLGLYTLRMTVATLVAATAADGPRALALRLPRPAPVLPGSSGASEQQRTVLLLLPPPSSTMSDNAAADMPSAGARPAPSRLRQPRQRDSTMTPPHPPHAPE